jgi:uncharacterized membrane protein
MGTASAVGSRLRDAGFDDDQLSDAAARMPPNSSALFALGTRAWVDYMNEHLLLDDLLTYLNQVAYQVGWIPVSETLADALARRDSGSS